MRYTVYRVHVYCKSSTKISTQVLKRSHNYQEYRKRVKEIITWKVVSEEDARKIIA
jgi:hypothetical protein